MIIIIIQLTLRRFCGGSDAFGNWLRQVRFLDTGIVAKEKEKGN